MFCVRSLKRVVVGGGLEYINWTLCIFLLRDRANFNSMFVSRLSRSLCGQTPRERDANNSRAIEYIRVGWENKLVWISQQVFKSANVNCHFLFGMPELFAYYCSQSSFAELTADRSPFSFLVRKRGVVGKGWVIWRELLGGLLGVAMLAIIENNMSGNHHCSKYSFDIVVF